MKLEVTVDERCEGSILAEPIFAGNGAKIIAEGAALSPKMIEKLLKMGIETVVINGEGDDADIESPNATQISLKLKNDIIKELESSFFQVKNGRFMNIPQLKKLVLELVEEVYRSKPAKSFNRLSNPNTLLPVHSLNVTMLALFTAREMGYSYDKAYQISMGALLHDVGKIIDPSNHCQEGLTHLRKYSELTAMIYLPAFQHHPEKLKMPNGAPMHEFSKVVTVCDLFERFTDSNQLTSQEVAKKMISLIGENIDRQCVIALLQGTAKKN